MKMMIRLEKTRKFINIEYGYDRTVSNYVTTRKDKKIDEYRVRK